MRFLQTENLSLFDLTCFLVVLPLAWNLVVVLLRSLCWSWWSSDANRSALQSHPVLPVRMTTSFVMKNWTGTLLVSLLCLLEVRVQIDHHGVATFVCLLQEKNVDPRTRSAAVTAWWRRGPATIFVPSLDHLSVDTFFCETLGVPLSMAVPFEKCCVPFQMLLCFGDVVICATLYASVSSWESCPVYRRLNFWSFWNMCWRFWKSDSQRRSTLLVISVHTCNKFVQVYRNWDNIRTEPLLSRSESRALQDSINLSFLTRSEMSWNSSLWSLGVSLPKIGCVLLVFEFTGFAGCVRFVLVVRDRSFLNVLVLLSAIKFPWTIPSLFYVCFASNNTFVSQSSQTFLNFQLCFFRLSWEENTRVAAG